MPLFIVKDAAGEEIGQVYATDQDGAKQRAISLARQRVLTAAERWTFAEVAEETPEVKDG